MAKLKKRSDGNYQKQITIGKRLDGTYIRKSIYAPTLKELERKVLDAQQKIRQCVFILDEKTTFADIAKTWLEDYNPTMSEKWHQRQRLLINKHLIPTLGSMRVCEIKQYHLQMLINGKAKDNYATGTMKQIKQTAARILEVAVQSELILRNVFEKVKVPSVPPRERKALTPKQIELINETWETHFMGYPAMIMLYCGLRRGELLALTWGDIDLKKNIISVNKSVEILTNQAIVKSPKSKAGYRIVPIPTILHDVLLQVVGDKNDLVCPSRHGEVMTGSAWSSAWYSYMNHLNLYCGGRNASRSKERKQTFEKFTAHMLRHTYATMLYDAGVDVKSAQYFLGHASIELTLSIYTHLTPFKMDQAIGTLNLHLNEIADIEITGQYADYKDE